MIIRSLVLCSWVALSGCAGDGTTDKTDADPTTDPTADTGGTTDTDTIGTTDTDTGTTDTGPTTTACSYPEFVVPMTIDEVLSPFTWPTAIHRDGRQGDLDLEAVPCGDDPDIDWSVFDALVFVSIPAW